MAIRNRIDLASAPARLAGWCARLWNLPDARVTDAQVPRESGISAETLMFRLSWADHGVERSRELVARVQPSTGGIWEHPDLGPEFELMRALRSATDVPVPDVLALERDPSILGAPFLLMERVAGRVPRDDPPFTTSGWVLALTPAEQARLHDNGLRTLAAIHAVAPTAVGLQARAAAGSEALLDAALAHWRRFYAFASNGRSHRVFDAAFEWLDAHRPREPEPTVISWGDARPGNLIFADDLSVAAVIDWELAALGSPELDLGWWVFIMRHHTEGIGAPMPAGFPGAEDTIRRYEAASGHQVRHFDFYYVFAGLRIALAFLRGGHLMIEAGLLPPDAPMPTSNPASHLLAQALGLPPPGAAVQSYIGKR